MAYIVWGQHVFNKNLGAYGEFETCPTCGRTYRKEMVRTRVWFHIEFIPLFPIKSYYNRICPFCSKSEELDKAAAKGILAGQKMTDQNLVPYAKRDMSLKPKKLREKDQSYELWIRDNVTGEDFCLAKGLSYDIIKNQKKIRGVKGISVTKYNA